MLTESGKNVRIIELPDLSELENGYFVPVDSPTGGTKKYHLADLLDLAGGGCKVVSINPVTEEPAVDDPKDTVLYLTVNDDGETYSQWVYQNGAWVKLKFYAEDIEYDKGTTPADIEETVATVNKMKEDLDTQLIVNYPMSCITKETDYASATGYDAQDGATVYFAFTIPINSSLKIIPANSENSDEKVTMISIYASRQDYPSKIILGLYEYDFATNSSDYVADTGAVLVSRGGRNEFPLVHINPDKTEMSSGKLYYIALHIQPSRSANGLFLLCNEGMGAIGSAVNFVPAMAIKSHDDRNAPKIDFNDPDVGLNVPLASGGYEYGPWTDRYTKAYNIPAFFVSMRNGIYVPPPPPPPQEDPFVDIGTYTTSLVNISNVIGRSCGQNETKLLRQIQPLADVTITDWTIIDENPTDDAKFGCYMLNSALSVITDKNNTQMTNNNGNVTVTNESIGGGLYSHTYHSSCGIDFEKDAVYYISCHSLQGWSPQQLTQIVQYTSPVNKTDLILPNSQWGVENPSRFNDVQAPYLKVKTSDGDEFTI